MKSLFWHQGCQKLGTCLLWLAMGPFSLVSAADTTWTAGSDNYTNPAAWSVGVPGEGDNAFFNNNATYTVSWTTSTNTASAYFNAPGGLVTLDLGANTWTLTNIFMLGQNAGNNGSVTMSGGTLSLPNAGITVGLWGQNTFNLTNGTVNVVGGSVNQYGQNSVLNISGPGSSFASSGSAFYLGYGHSSPGLGEFGKLIVTNGAQFSVTSGIFYIGYNGRSNQLIVADGGTVNTADAWLSTTASANGNSALVTGNNSLWNSSSGITVGMGGGGGNSLVVSNGGTVSSPHLAVGNGASSNTLTIYSGSKVLATNVTISLSAGTTSNSLRVLGGSLYVTNSAGGAALTVGGSGVGDLTLQGGLVKADKLTVQNGILNNVGGVVTASQFVVSYGTVNTRNGSTTDVGTAGFLSIGKDAGHNATWNVTAGTNTIVASAVRVGENAGAAGTLNVTGSDTVLTNTGSLEIGRYGNNSTMTVSGGARADAEYLYVGFVGTNNQVQVFGTNSAFKQNNAIFLGYFGKNNQLIVSNNATASTAGTLYIGYAGAGNQLIITDGGHMTDAGALFGTDGGGGGSNGYAIVTGDGSLWTSAGITLGHNASGSQIIVTNGGTVRTAGLAVGSGGSRNRADVGTGGTLIVTNSLIIGYNTTSTSNLVMVSGGSMVITNSAGTAKLVAGNAGEGTFTLNGGSVVVDQLFATNGVKSVANLQAGTLTTRSTTVSNTAVFTVGDGVQVATLKLNGGSHLFADGLTVANNGTLAGTGTVNSVVAVANGGALAPGMSPGTLTINSNLTLNVSSLLNFELGPHDINGNGYVGGGTNDLIVVNGDLVLDGILNVTALPGWDTIVNTRTNIYRLLDYTGTLTDNSLSFGLMPGDVNAAYIDTSVFGQVNLIVVIPEPSAIALLAVAGLGLLVRRRK